MTSRLESFPSVVLVKLIEDQDQVRSLILSLIVIVVHQMVRGVVILLGWRLSFLEVWADWELTGSESANRARRFQIVTIFGWFDS